MSGRAPKSLAELRKRVGAVRLRGADAARARQMLDLYLDTAERHGQSLDVVLREVKAGLPALRIGGAELQGQAASEPVRTAACAPGCAFCCILAGDEGAVILEAEARHLHAALAPLAGAPDGRAWSSRACPALDPDTRMCRAYDARPMICRTYLSPDSEACRSIAEGVPAPGPVTLGAQRLYLTVQALGRAALAGHVTVPTYALSRIAAAAVEGRDLSAALREARHKPRTLDDERARLAPPHA
ncbi:YkgJ family cysteine cluster protein [Roseivivax sediminis]|uniref:Zinc-or iron-chelating domain-containing protein n=1 Tax=Roseivivax sediminis TaxID=936889 RepID=A0A1I1VGD5_9RHOB|nr:YkgJ family cysteine cluster protein [Roseivivax sediminis]SFD81048.1 Putative zinc-or iron-chelating domain-containing protein [Roseivivax sediminis]